MQRTLKRRDPSRKRLGSFRTRVYAPGLPGTKCLVTDAVDAGLAAGTVDAGPAVAGDLVHGGAEVVLTEGELSGDHRALVGVFTRDSADAVDTGEATFAVVATAVRAVVGTATSVVAVASFATLGVEGATVVADGVDADAAFTTLRVACALAGDGRRRDAEAIVAAHLTCDGAGLFVARGDAGAVDAGLTRGTFVVELTGVFHVAALAGDAEEISWADARHVAGGRETWSAAAVLADEAGFALRVVCAGVGVGAGSVDAAESIVTAGIAFTDAAFDGAQLAVTIETEETVVTLLVRGAGPWVWNRRRLGGLYAESTVAAVSFGAVGIDAALRDAARVRADFALGTLVVTTARGPWRRFNKTASKSIAVVATSVVAVVAFTLTASERGKGSNKKWEVVSHDSSGGACSGWNDGLPLTYTGIMPCF